LENVFRRARQETFGDMIKKIPNIKNKNKLTPTRITIKRKEYAQSIIPKETIKL
jgi:hypothetical protein